MKQFIKMFMSNIAEPFLCHDYALLEKTFDLKHPFLTVLWFLVPAQGHH
jgi:hypothetical protein